MEVCLNSRRSRYATKSDNTIVSFRQPDGVDDSLTTVLKSGAHCPLAQAIEAEAEAFLAAMKDKRLADGRERVVQHGHGPERVVQTGIGSVAVQWVKLCGRSTSDLGEHICFTSTILLR